MVSYTTTLVDPGHGTLIADPENRLLYAGGRPLVVVDMTTGARVYAVDLGGPAMAASLAGDTVLVRVAALCGAEVGVQLWTLPRLGGGEGKYTAYPATFADPTSFGCAVNKHGHTAHPQELSVGGIATVVVGDQVVTVWIASAGGTLTGTLQVLSATGTRTGLPMPLPVEVYGTVVAMAAWGQDVLLAGTRGEGWEVWPVRLVAPRPALAAAPFSATLRLSRCAAPTVCVSVDQICVHAGHAVLGLRTPFGAVLARVDPGPDGAAPREVASEVVSSASLGSQQVLLDALLIDEACSFLLHAHDLSLET